MRVWSDLRLCQSFSFGDIQMCAAIWWVRWSPYPTLTLSSLKACQSEEDLRCTLVSPYHTGEMSITAFSTQTLRLTPALNEPPTHTHTHTHRVAIRVRVKMPHPSLPHRAALLAALCPRKWARETRETSIRPLCSFFSLHGRICLSIRICFLLTF